MSTVREPALRCRRNRPTWHRIVGLFSIVVGLGVVVVNYVAISGPQLLPGGHQEAYFLLGVIVAGSGTWWFGLFDRAR